MAKNQEKIDFLTNYYTVEVEKKEVDQPLETEAILKRIQDFCPNLVSIAGIINHVDKEKNEIREIDKPRALEGLLAEYNVNVGFKKKPFLLSFEGFFNYLQNNLVKFQRAVRYPIYPPQDTILELNPVKPEATFALDNLLSFFKPASEQDRAILKALFCTPAWSEGIGRRPIFVIMAADHLDTGVKIGKSTVVQFLGQLYGGIIGPFKSTDDDTAITEKLATFPDRAIILYDNIKRNNWSSESLEFLVTAKTLTARRVYIGPVTIENHFTICVTLNNPSLSPDLASRAVVIRLDKPDMSAAWEDEVANYIEVNRKEIFKDIIHILAAKTSEQKPATRFPGWERIILNKCAAGSDISTYIETSQDQIEAKLDTGEWEVYVAEQLQLYFYRLKESTYQVGVHVDVGAIEWLVSSRVWIKWYADWTQQRETPIATREAQTMAKRMGSMWEPSKSQVFRFGKKIFRGVRVKKKGVNSECLQGYIELHSRERAEILVRSK